MKTGTVTDVVLWKRKRTDAEGMISLREDRNGKRTYKSLGVRIPAKYWDEASQRVKRTDALDYKTINSTITTKLAEVAEVNNLADVSPAAGSFTSYAESFINSITSHGSRTKYQTVYNKLKAFLKQRNQLTLRFEELTPELVRELHTYLLKTIERNTANHYMKMYSQIINRAIKERKHTYAIHPYISVDYTRTNKKREILSESEIKAFRLAVVPDRLRLAQNAFLFQLLAQGMRVSDMMRLRWSNIQPDGHIAYTMFKTGKEMSVFINDKMYSILIEIAEQLPALKQHKDLNKIRETLRISQEKAIDSVMMDKTIQTLPIGYLHDETFIDNELVVDYQNNLRWLRDSLTRALSSLATHPKYANEHIFSFLSTTDFPKPITSISIADKQYKTMHNAKVVYNRHLKEIQKLAKISTNITSHLARHAYTNLLLTDREGYDVYDISKALGHSSLKITESYIGTFSKSHTGKINEAIAKRLDW
ncbi:hypothetical protein D3Y59_11275 [Hymenobacter oligotrophus]|uniref:Site-specific integrase n=1 Tax=Hymenobacter oligotrophus TaxID=2319843 RepID=A0A3B7QWS1_9BACT|nr:site-specific integrase [Hymenobacter oligotrophus]AYA37578.1 hypothetical protein D3Y59_11275 [Hymenobacter oligotrophus]